MDNEADVNNDDPKESLEDIILTFEDIVCHSTYWKHQTYKKLLRKLNNAQFGREETGKWSLLGRSPP